MGAILTTKDGLIHELLQLSNGHDLFIQVANTTMENSIKAFRRSYPGMSNGAWHAVELEIRSIVSDCLDKSKEMFGFFVPIKPTHWNLDQKAQNSHQIRAYRPIYEGKNSP